MGMIDNAESMKEKAQEKVPEPLLAVGIVQPAGTWGSAGVMQVSGLAGMLMKKSANKKAGDLHTGGTVFKTNRQTLLALTADKLYAFETKAGWGGMKIIGDLAQWDRKDLRVGTEDGKLSTQIVIEHTVTGDRYELEATTAMSRGFNDALLEEIVKPVG
jgi:hypothetical protein